MSLALIFKGLGHFVSGLVHEAALCLWRGLLPASYAEDFELDDKSRRAVIAFGAGFGLVATLLVAAK